MTDMRDEDWRQDESLSEADIRRRLAEERWEPVDVRVGVRLQVTTGPSFVTAAGVNPIVHVTHQGQLPESV